MNGKPANSFGKFADCPEKASNLNARQEKVVSSMGLEPMTP